MSYDMGQEDWYQFSGYNGVLHRHCDGSLAKSINEYSDHIVI